jgi:hypothetical protein
MQRSPFQKNHKYRWKSNQDKTLDKTPICFKSVISYQLSVSQAGALGDALTATNALWSNWWGTRDHSYLTDNCGWYCSLLKGGRDKKKNLKPSLIGKNGLGNLLMN